jgi:hypothetical protein
MSRFSLALFSLVVLVFAAHLSTAATTQTFVVGNCQPKAHTYPTINAAVSTVPSGSIVKVCPGTYNEQVHITQPLTLEGISADDSDAAVITTTGLSQNASNVLGNIFAQVFVDNVVGGPVIISAITVDGANNGVGPCSPAPLSLVVGVFYQNSSGTVNLITARNQNGNDCGTGVLVEGGSALPSVTVENSSIHGADGGIETETFSSPGSSELSATITGNFIDLAGATPGAGSQGIVINEGANTAVSGNIVINSDFGITAQGGSLGSISGNTVMSSPFGIEPFSDAVSVTANRIFNSSIAAINIQGTTVATVQGNRVTNSKVGIEFTCTADPNVTKNVIIDTSTGLQDVPGGLSVPNMYFNVPTIRGGGC